MALGRRSQTGRLRHSGAVEQSGRLTRAARFQELYERLAPRLLVYLSAKTADVEIARDLWAESWARAWEGRARLSGDSAAEEEAWVVGIAKRVLANYYRRGEAEQRAMKRVGLERPRLGDEDIRRIEEMAALDEFRDALADALAALPVHQREAVRLRLVDQTSYPDIARMLGISEQTSRARVSRGVRAMRDVLEPRAGDLGDIG